MSFKYHLLEGPPQRVEVHLGQWLESDDALAVVGRGRGTARTRLRHPPSHRGHVAGEGGAHSARHHAGACKRIGCKE